MQGGAATPTAAAPSLRYAAARRLPNHAAFPPPRPPARRSRRHLRAGAAAGRRAGADHPDERGRHHARRAPRHAGAGGGRDGLPGLGAGDPGRDRGDAGGAALGGAARRRRASRCRWRAVSPVAVARPRAGHAAAAGRAARRRLAARACAGDAGDRARCARLPRRDRLGRAGAGPVLRRQGFQRGPAAHAPGDVLQRAGPGPAGAAGVGADVWPPGPAGTRRAGRRDRPCRGALGRGAGLHGLRRSPPPLRGPATLCAPRPARPGRAGRPVAAGRADGRVDLHGRQPVRRHRAAGGLAGRGAGSGAPDRDQRRLGCIHAATGHRDGDHRAGRQRRRPPRCRGRGLGGARRAAAGAGDASGFPAVDAGLRASDRARLHRRRGRDRDGHGAAAAGRRVPVARRHPGALQRRAARAQGHLAAGDHHHARLLGRGPHGRRLDRLAARRRPARASGSD